MSGKRIYSKMIGAGVFVDTGFYPAIQIVSRNIDYELLSEWLLTHSDVCSIKRMTPNSIKVHIKTELNYMTTADKLDKELKCQFL